jgi:hypothetical protein
MAIPGPLSVDAAPFAAPCAGVPFDSASCAAVPVNSASFDSLAFDSLAFDSLASAASGDAVADRGVGDGRRGGAGFGVELPDDPAGWDSPCTLAPTCRDWAGTRAASSSSASMPSSSWLPRKRRPAAR